MSRVGPQNRPSSGPFGSLVQSVGAPLSSRGLGRRPLMAETRVRIPAGVLERPRNLGADWVLGAVGKGPGEWAPPAARAPLPRRLMVIFGWGGVLRPQPGGRRGPPVWAPAAHG